MAEKPGEDVEIRVSVVFAGDVGGVGFRFPRQQAEDFWEGGEGGEGVCVFFDEHRQPLHICVRRDDVHIALMNRRDRAGLPPVHEVPREDLDILEWKPGLR